MVAFACSAAADTKHPGAIVIITRWWTDDTFETGGSFVPKIVAEARAGILGPGDFELDVGASTSGPFGPGQIAQFTWGNGVWYPFSFTHDPGIPRQTWTVAAVTTTAAVMPATPLNALFLRTAANPIGGSIGFDSLRISSAGIGSPTVDIPLPGGGPGPASVIANGPSARRSLQLTGALLSAGFIITGRVVLGWTGSMPQRSNLSAQIKTGFLAGIGSTMRAGEDDRPRRWRPVRYPAILLPVLLAAAEPDWATVMPDIIAALGRDPR